MRYVLAPFKYVLGKFWIWAGGFILGGGLLLGVRDYAYTYIYVHMHIKIW